MKDILYGILGNRLRTGSAISEILIMTYTYLDITEYNLNQINSFDGKIYTQDLVITDPDIVDDLPDLSHEEINFREMKNDRTYKIGIIELKFYLTPKSYNVIDILPLFTNYDTTTPYVKNYFTKQVNAIDIIGKFILRLGGNIGIRWQNYLMDIINKKIIVNNPQTGKSIDKMDNSRFAAMEALSLVKGEFLDVNIADKYVNFLDKPDVFLSMKSNIQFAIGRSILKWTYSGRLDNIFLSTMVQEKIITLLGYIRDSKHIFENIPSLYLNINVANEFIRFLKFATIKKYIIPKWKGIESLINDLSLSPDYGVGKRLKKAMDEVPHPMRKSGDADDILKRFHCRMITGE